jgi:predicted hydrocarbon binding protein
MHGTMFLHLRTFVEEHHGDAAWRSILDRAGLGPRVYLPIKSYPDEELAAIVTTAANALNAPLPRLLEDFGRHVAPHLMAMYRHLLRPEWRTLEVLLHVEETAHRAVRIEKPGAAPPYLEARRTGERRVEIHYTSARRLCPVAKGIIRGLSSHFAEEISISEPACMHRGADRCRIVVETIP